MAQINVNSMTKSEVVSAMSVYAHRYFQRQYIEKNQHIGRQWLVKHLPQIYMAVGLVTTRQTQTARRGDYTDMYDSEEEEEEETTSDDDFIADDDEEEDMDEDYEEDSEDEDSEDEDDTMETD